MNRRTWLKAAAGFVVAPAAVVLAKVLPKQKAKLRIVGEAGGMDVVDWSSGPSKSVITALNVVPDAKVPSIDMRNFEQVTIVGTCGNSPHPFSFTLDAATNVV